jgi:hypothetical protein
VLLLAIRPLFICRHGRRAMLLCRDPLVRSRVQQVERQDASVKHLIVEGAQVETCPQFLLGSFAQLPEFELAELVCERLRRPGNVAIGFCLERRLIDRVGFAKELDARST